MITKNNYQNLFKLFQKYKWEWGEGDGGSSDHTTYLFLIAARAPVISAKQKTLFDRQTDLFHLQSWSKMWVKWVWWAFYTGHRPWSNVNCLVSSSSRLVWKQLDLLFSSVSSLGTFCHMVQQNCLFPYIHHRCFIKVSAKLQCWLHDIYCSPEDDPFWF